MRPVNPNPVTDLAAEQRVARHLQRLSLGVKQRVFDRPQPLADHSARRRPGQAIELGIDPLMLEHVLANNPRRHALDDGADPGGAETLVELTPADNAAVGREL